MKVFSRLFTLVALVGILNSCEEKKEEKSTEKPLEVQGFVVQGQPFKNELITTASLLANEQVEIKSPVSGQVMGIYFKEGDKVQEGALLVQVDDRTWKAQLIGVTAELETAEKDLTRKNALLKIGGSSQEEVDRAVSTVESLKSQLQQLRVNIDLAKITAPFSGRLGMRDFSKGAFLSQGSLITTLSEINQLKVDFMVSQNHLPSISIGKNVKVLINEDSMNASIYAVNPVIDPETRMVNARAMLKQNDKMEIMPGTFAEVLVTTNYLNNALLIPTQAVVPSINEQTVYVSENRKAVRRVVEMGNRTSDMVHILNGVKLGDTVLTTGLLSIKDGMDLIFQSVK